MKELVLKEAEGAGGGGGAGTWTVARLILGTGTDQSSVMRGDNSMTAITVGHHMMPHSITITRGYTLLIMSLTLPWELMRGQETLEIMIPTTGLGGIRGGERGGERRDGELNTKTSSSMYLILVCSFSFYIQYIPCMSVMSCIEPLKI